MTIFHQSESLSRFFLFVLLHRDYVELLVIRSVHSLVTVLAKTFMLLYIWNLYFGLIQIVFGLKKEMKKNPLTQSEDLTIKGFLRGSDFL